MDSSKIIGICNKGLESDVFELLVVMWVSPGYWEKWGENVWKKSLRLFLLHTHRSHYMLSAYTVFIGGGEKNALFSLFFSAYNFFDSKERVQRFEHFRQLCGVKFMWVSPVFVMITRKRESAIGNVSRNLAGRKGGKKSVLYDLCTARVNVWAFLQYYMCTPNHMANGI